MARIRILLADDHTILRQGIRALLEAEPDMEVVGEAVDGQEAVEMARVLAPDIVLMDVAMPLMDGIASTRRIKQERPATQVVVLTMYETENYIARVLGAGATGYVLKHVAATDLVYAIRSVHQGGAFLHPIITKKLVGDYLRRIGESGDKTSDGLTDREHEVLKLIVEGKTNKAIAQILCLSIKTVQTHRTHIMDKLGAHDRTELVKYAIRKGLVSLET